MNLLAGATQEVEKVGEWASRQLDVVQLLQEEAQHWRVQLSQEDGRCALLAETSLEQQLLELGQEHGKALAQLHRLMKLPGQQLQQLGKALSLEQQLWEALAGAATGGGFATGAAAGGGFGPGAAAGEGFATGASAGEGFGTAAAAGEGFAARAETGSGVGAGTGAATTSGTAVAGAGG